MFKLAWSRKRAPTGKNGRKRESSQLTDSKYLSSSRAPAKGLCPTKNAAGGRFQGLRCRSGLAGSASKNFLGFLWAQTSTG